MTYYLKKSWRKNLMVVAVQLMIYSLTAYQALVQIQLFQCLFEWNTEGLIFWVGVNAAVWIVYFLLQILRTRLYASAVRSMNHQVRRDMAATLLSKNHQDYHDQESGEYLSWFTSGVERIESTAWNSFFQLTTYIVMIVTSLVALVTIHWWLLLSSLAIALVLTVLPNLFTKKMEHLGAVCAQEQAAATGKLKDLLSGFDILRFFGRSARFLWGINQASDQIETPKYEQTCKQGVISSGILGILETLINVGNLLFIALLSLNGIIIQSALAGVGNLCGSINSGVQGIADLRLSIASSKAYLERITVHADDLHDMHQGSPAAPVQEAITVENVSFQYDRKPVLQNMTVRFETGKKYALTGPSGCGKSTLLKLLLGWLPDYTGSIRFDGKDARSYTPEQLQQQMSYIEQNVFLFNTTIRENITLGEAFSEEALQKALQNSALARDLANMPDGLDTIVGEEGSSLSGGQKQRIAIARALIHNRSILLVDEGTSALDRENADIVEQSLLSNPDLTLILVSHHLSPERKEQFDQVYDLQVAAANVAGV